MSKMHLKTNKIVSIIIIDIIPINYNPVQMDPLLEIAYALQIDYNPDQPDYDSIHTQLDTIKLYSVTKDRILWEQEIRNHRRTNRSVNCQESVTFVMRKDIDLMSEAQLVYLPAKTQTTFYPLDAVTDVDAVLNLKIHPFTHEPLTSEQIIFLETAKCNHRYPRISVGDFFEEVDARLYDTPQVYTEKPYHKKMGDLSVLIENVGLKYESDIVCTFATDLNLGQYNLFLKHQPINQILDLCDRDIASSITLNHILNYITLQTQRSTEHGKVATVYLGKAIDEFIYMIRNGLSYEDLLKERGIANELNWKPVFVKEKYYDDGTLRVQYFTDQEERKHGTCTRYYSNGTLGYEGTYVHGTEQSSTYSYGDGIKTSENGVYWYPNGKLMVHNETGFDENGSSLGTVTCTITSRDIIPNEGIHIIIGIESGLVDTLEFYEDGKLEGPYWEWALDGSLYVKGYYKMEQKTGIWKEFSSEGCYEADKKIGIWREWYGDGNLLKESFYDNDELYGLYQEWNRMGILILEGLYINNLKVGLWTRWYQNGQLGYQKSFVNGERHGICYVWYDNGCLQSQGCYEFDKQIGLQTYFNRDGSLKETYFCDDNGRCGLYQAWTNSIITSEGLYLNNERVGYWVLNEYGTVSYGTYLNGKRHGLWLITKYGVPLDDITYELNNQHGMRIKYYPNGQIYLCGDYKHNQPNGPWKYYYPNGQLAASGNYTYTNPYFSCWDPQGLYIGERLIDRSGGIHFLTKTGIYDGMYTTNIGDGTTTVAYYHDGRQVGTTTKWIWNGNKYMCTPF